MLKRRCPLCDNQRPIQWSVYHGETGPKGDRTRVGARATARRSSKARGRLSYSRLKSYACPSENVSRRVLGLPSLSFWNCAKAIGNGPRLAAIAANFPSGTNVAV